MVTDQIILSDYIKTGTLSAADEEKLACAAQILRKGGLVAFPTETVYGLGGNALLKDASERIYAAKGRPSDNPLIVHISCMEELEPLVREIPPEAEILASRFWPGPLTMILPKSDAVPHETTGGLDTVAVRMPAHPAAMRLIALSGVPIAAPSANTSGRPSPTEAQHVAEDLDGKIDAILDGGPVPIGVESTIIDLTEEEPVLLRPGAVTEEMLAEALSERVLRDPALEKPLDASVHPRAPGMKYRHYAPKAPMTIVMPKSGSFTEETSMAVAERVCALAEKPFREGKRTCILCTDETLPVYRTRFFGENADGRGILLLSMGSRAEGADPAHNLFRILREADELGAEAIVAEGVSEEAIGYAVMNRMKKAAGQQVEFV